MRGDLYKHLGIDSSTDRIPINLEFVLLPQRKQGFTLLFFIKKLFVAQYFEFFVGFL